MSCFWSLEWTQRSSSARTRRSKTLRAEASDRGETREGQQGGRRERPSLPTERSGSERTGLRAMDAGGLFWVLGMGV